MSLAHLSLCDLYQLSERAARVKDTSDWAKAVKQELERRIGPEKQIKLPRRPGGLVVVD